MIKKMKPNRMSKEQFLELMCELYDDAVKHNAGIVTTSIVIDEDLQGTTMRLYKVQ